MTKFEHLPNELILDIFKYCNASDLFISLFNLNNRLNTLIYIQPLHIDLGYIIPKFSLDLYYESILFDAREQIHTLRFADTYGRMHRFVTNDNQIEMDFETRKYILSQVKSLILWNPMMTSLEWILIFVNNLEHLEITILERTEYTSDYIHRLFNSLLRMTTLKRLCLELYATITFDHDIGPNTSLTHVTLHGCEIQDLAPLLRRIPHIQKLNIVCYNRRNLVYIDEETFDYSSYDGLADCIPYLTHLKLDIYHTPFKEVEVFLRQLPQLIKFTFSSIIIENYSNGSNWERVIKNCLPNLKKLSLSVNKKNIRKETLIDLDEIIQSFTSLFWDQWPIIIEYYAGATDEKHLSLYTLPIQQDVLRTYFYGTQTRENNINCNNDIRKKLDELYFVLSQNPSSRSVVSNRIYSNIKTLLFSSELVDTTAYETETILTDLQHICSTSALSKIDRLYLYDQIYPTNFLSKLLNLLPNLYFLRIPASVIDISSSLPLLTNLTIDFNSTSAYYPTDVLRQMGIQCPKITSIRFELASAQDIYILLSYCLRKFRDRLDIEIRLHEITTHIDEEEFLLWFNDYQQLNGLDDKTQVEFNDQKNLLYIS